jgi:DNA polymerase-3 subunit delta
VSPTVDAVLVALEGAANEPIYLVSGDLVLAEPAARRLAEALAARGQAQVETLRRPARLADALGDLRTYSLFAGCRVMLVVESALLADHRAAAELLDAVAEELPAAADGELGRGERAAASRLLQVLRLFELDPYHGAAAETIARLPDWALAGGRSRGRKRAKREVEALRDALAPLLDRARTAGLYGSAESDVAELAHILDNGLPPGHALVMAESAVAPEHPLVAALDKRGALIELAHVEGGRGGEWSGVEALAAQLEEETGVGIEPRALDELAARTLRAPERAARAQADSSARLAAEYRKLAALAGDRRIGLAMVREAVEDRGQEDMWKVLDAIGEGKGGEALRRIDRLLAAAEDEVAERLLLFGLLAGFCRHLAAVSGAMRTAGVPPGVRSYPRFKSTLAPRLQADLETGENPLKGVHPFRLHRAYLAASRLPPDLLRTLPWRVLETELRLKGESRDAASALALLVSDLATAAP